MIEQQADQPGQGDDAAHQPQPDRQVGRHWDAINGWSPRQQYASSYQNNTKPARRGANFKRAHALERLRRRQAGRLPRGPPAARQGGAQPQRTVQKRRQPIPLQGRRHPGKIAATQVATQQAQRGGSQGRAQGDAQQTARQAQDCGFPQHQAQALAAGQPQHAQQGELLGAFGHTQGQHREHQKRAGEQRHQGQHAQVDAVGARQVAQAGGVILWRGQAQVLGPIRRVLQGLREGFAPHAGPQPDVDAREQAGLAKTLLRRANVHHRQRRAAGLHRARDLQGHRVQP